LLRTASVYQHRMGDIERAQRALEQIHQQVDATNEAAAVALAPIYADAGETQDQLRVLQIILGHRTDLDERRSIQLELARLHAEALEDGPGALEWYAQIYAEDPRRFEDAERMEAAAAEIDGWRKVEGLYRDALSSDAAAEDEALELELRMRLGRVLAAEQGRHDEALSEYQTILAKQPEFVRAMAAMERIYTELKLWNELMGVYNLRLELVTETSDRVEILRGMALIAEEQAGDRDKAIEQYLAAYELDPEDAQSLRELHRLYHVQERYEDMADIIRKEIALLEERGTQRRRATQSRGRVDTSSLVPLDSALYAERGVDAPDMDEVEEELEEAGLAPLDADGHAADDELEAGVPPAVESTASPMYTEDEIEQLVELRFELGHVCKHHLGAHDQAITSFGVVMRMRPNEERAVTELEDYFRQGEPYAVPVATILEPVHEVHGRWHDLIRCLRVLAEDADTTEEKVSIHERIGSLYVEETGEPKLGFSAYGDALRLEPDHPAVRQKLSMLADALVAWDDLVALYEDVLPGTGEPESALRVEYLFMLGGLYAERVADPANAQRMFYEVLEVRPESHDALGRLEELYTRTDQWREMLDVYERQLALATQAEDVEQAKHMQLKIASLYEEQLGEPQEAITVLQAVLDTDPENPQARHMLNRLFAAEKMWDQLADNLRELLQRADDDTRDDVQNQLARVYADEVGQLDTAVDLYEDVLERDRFNEGAISSLESMMRYEGAPAERISALLEPRFEERADWARLINALKVQVEVSPDPAQRVALRHRIVRLYIERLVEPQEAFDTMCEALGDDVHNDTTLRMLEQLAEAVDGFAQLVATYEDVAATHEDPEVKRDLLRRASSIYLERLDDIQSTSARLREVIEILPDDLESIDDLLQIYQHLQEWANLVDVLIRKADVVLDVGAKMPLLFQAGTLYEEMLQQPLDAIRVYQMVLELDPVDLEAIERLERLYTQEEQWNELLDIYGRKLDLAQGVEVQKDLLYVIGELHQRQLDQPHDAIDTYRRVLDLDPLELKALAKLDELFVETQQWNELLDTLRREIELVQIPNDRHRLQFRVGRLFEEHLADGIQAIEEYREVLAENPAHEDTTQALLGMIERGEHEVEAAEVLLPLYEMAEAWEPLVFVHRKLLESTSDPERKLRLYDVIGETLETRMYDQAGAFSTYAEALGVEPGRLETLDTLERLAGELDWWPKLIARLDELIETTNDFSAQAVMHKRIARISRNQLGDQSAASERYRRVLEIDPVDEDALPQLDELYQAEGRWEELAEILAVRVEQELDPERSIGFQLRLGVLYQTLLGRTEDALETYRKVLGADPDNRDAIAQLEEMFMGGHEVAAIV
ncbi:MAG: tetratricopeptide repeat protein, partial [Myxococcota bacterium]